MEIKTTTKKRNVQVHKKVQSLFPSLDEIERKRKEHLIQYGFSPAISGELMSIGQLKEIIHEAEQGPFYTLEQGQQMIKQWREQRQNR